MAGEQTSTRSGVRFVGGVLLVAFVIAAHFYMPAQSSALALEVIRSLHGPGFGLVALVVVKLARFKGGPVAAYWKAAAATMLLAVVSEAAQIPSEGRAAQLDDLFIDGLVHVTSLGNDYYHAEHGGLRLTGERTGASFGLGDAVTVRVTRVDTDEAKLDLALVDEASNGDRRPGRARGRRRRRQ